MHLTSEDSFLEKHKLAGPPTSDGKIHEPLKQLNITESILKPTGREQRNLKIHIQIIRTQSSHLRELVT